MARFSLSRMASALSRIDRGEDEMHEDLKVWHAPSECHGDVARQAEHERIQALDEGSWTYPEFIEELETRISGKAIYRLGF